MLPITILCKQIIATITPLARAVIVTPGITTRMGRDAARLGRNERSEIEMEPGTMTRGARWNAIIAIALRNAM